jgi:hypothetical protein
MCGNIGISQAGVNIDNIAVNRERQEAIRGLTMPKYFVFCLMPRQCRFTDVKKSHCHFFSRLCPSACS